MLLAIDVQYEELAATTACVAFADWRDETTTFELVTRSESIAAAYEPGEFYKRELAHLIDAIAQLEQRHAPRLVIIDAYVWLDVDKPGLGAHLHAALGERLPIVGVAKTTFRGAPSIPVLRGQSQNPLLVTAIGVDAAAAAEAVRTMHGPHRIPTLLKRADQLARGHMPPDPAKAI